MIDYRLTVDIVDSMSPDSHLVDMGSDRAHTHINRNMDKSEYVYISFHEMGNIKRSIKVHAYEKGYIVASTKNSSKGEGVIVAANITMEDFIQYAKKYNGENTPEKIASNLKSISSFLSNK